MVKFTPRYTEEPYKFTLCHGYLSVSLANDLHIAAPIKIATMILRVSHCPLFIVRFHTVSSFLSFELTTNGIVFVFVFAFVVFLSFALYLAISLSISSEIFLSVTCA